MSRLKNLYHTPCRNRILEEKTTPDVNEEDGERERYCELIECNMLSPPSFEMENIVPPKGGGCCTWSEDVQPPQENLCLAAHSTHGQKLTEEEGCQGNLSFLRPHLAPSSHLRSGKSYSRHWKVVVVVDERVEVVWGRIGCTFCQESLILFLCCGDNIFFEIHM